MKKIIPAILVLVVAICAFGFSVKYKNEKITENAVGTTAFSVSHTAQDDDVQQNGESGVLYNKNGYKVSFNGKLVSVTYGEHKYSFKTWATSVNAETPTFYCKDYNGDGKKELLVRITNGLETDDSGTQTRTYAVYLLTPATKQNGGKTFSVTLCSADVWKTVFEKSIKCEASQPKVCKKYIQFAMNDASKGINYDDKTGLSDSKYVGYAAALSSQSKEYYTLNRWNRGLGIYSIDKNGDIVLDIQVLVNYEENTQPQQIGNIHCKIAYNAESDSFYVDPGTISFKPLDEYRVADPRKTASKNWSATIENATADTNFKSNEIDWIENKIDVVNLKSSQSEYFGTMSSKIKCVEKIKITQSQIVLTAKSGYEFSQNMVDRGQYSVTINTDEKNEIDISYQASVKTVNDKSTLTIKFDKTYNKADLKKFKINFGV